MHTKNKILKKLQKLFGKAVAKEDFRLLLEKYPI
jgi:hypothetical protein